MSGWKVFSFVGALCFAVLGTAMPAYAIGPCSVVCQQPNTFCGLRCYLSNNFVTTCGEVVSDCIGFPYNSSTDAATEHEASQTQPAMCMADDSESDATSGS